MTVMQIMLFATLSLRFAILPKVYSGQMVFYGADKNVKIISDTPITAASGQYCILYSSNYEVCFGCGEILAHSKCMEM